MIRRNILSDPGVAEQFVVAVQRMRDPQQMPWPGQAGLSIYDFFVFWHHRAMMLMTPPTQNIRNAAHNGPVFLPWHRYMLLMFEGFLREAAGDPQLRLPYWDWTEDATLPDPTRSPLWGPALMGGSGSNPRWPVRLGPNPTDQNPQRVDRPLERELGEDALGRLFTIDEVRALVANNPTYDRTPFDFTSTGFRNQLEGGSGLGFHNLVHVWVGGDMSASTSPNDPVFFLHHCNVDRIWAAWQQRWPGSPYVPGVNAPQDLLFHRLDDPMHTFFNQQVRPRDVLDVSTYYQYDTLNDILA